VKTTEFAPSYFISLTNGIIPLLLIFYITQFEGLEVAGNYFLLLSYAGLTQLIFDYGFNLGGIREVQENQNNKNTYATKKLLLISIILKALFIIVLFVFLFFINEVYFEINKNILFAVGLGSLVSLLNISWGFIGIKKTFEYYLFLLIYRLVFLMPIFFFELGILSYLSITLLPSCFLLLHYFKYLRNEQSFLRIFLQISYKDYIEVLSKYFSIFINGILGSGISLGWPLVLSFFLTTSQIGAFGFADRVIKGINMFFSPIPPLILSSQLQLKNLNAKIAFPILVIFLLPVCFIILPFSIFEKLNVSGFIAIKEEFEFYFFLIPIYLLNMLAYTTLLMKKLETYYFYSLLSSIIFILITSSIISNKFYLPLFFELTTLTISLIFLALYNKNNGKENKTS